MNRIVSILLILLVARGSLGQIAKVGYTAMTVADLEARDPVPYERVEVIHGATNCLWDQPRFFIHDPFSAATPIRGYVVTNRANSGRYVASDRWAGDHNIKHLLAIGDGISDDTPAFEAAQLVVTSGKQLEIPWGVYSVTRELPLPNDYTTYYGHGYNSDIRVAHNGNAFAHYGVLSGQPRRYGVQFKDLRFTVAGGFYPSNALHLGDVSYSLFERIFVTGGVAPGFASAVYTWGNYSIPDAIFGGNWGNKFVDCEFFNRPGSNYVFVGSGGIGPTGGPNDLKLIDNYFGGGLGGARTNGAAGAIWLENCNMVRISGNDIEQWSTNAIGIGTNATEIIIERNRFEHQGGLLDVRSTVIVGSNSVVTFRDNMSRDQGGVLQKFRTDSFPGTIMDTTIPINQWYSQNVIFGIEPSFNSANYEPLAAFTKLSLMTRHADYTNALVIGNFDGVHNPRLVISNEGTNRTVINSGSSIQSIPLYIVGSDTYAKFGISEASILGEGVGSAGRPGGGSGAFTVNGGIFGGREPRDSFVEGYTAMTHGAYMRTYYSDDIIGYFSQIVDGVTNRRVELSVRYDRVQLRDGYTLGGGLIEVVSGNQTNLVIRDSGVEVRTNALFTQPITLEIAAEPNTPTNAVSLWLADAAAKEIDLKWQDASISRVWHSGNHGSGSGLDADLLDGQDGSWYLATSNHTGNLTPSWVNVKDFGAVSGSTNDATPAFQAAVNSGAAVVYVPNGSYDLRSTLMVTNTVRVVGDHKDRTTIRYFGTNYAIQIGGGTNFLTRGASLENLFVIGWEDPPFTGSYAPSNALGMVHVYGGVRGSLLNVRVSNAATGSGLLFDRRAWYWDVDNFAAFDCGVGMNFQCWAPGAGDLVNTINVSGGNIAGCDIGVLTGVTNAPSGTAERGIATLKFNNISIESNRRIGMWLNQTEVADISTYWEGNGRDASIGSGAHVRLGNSLDTNSWSVSGVKFRSNRFASTTNNVEILSAENVSFDGNDHQDIKGSGVQYVFASTNHSKVHIGPNEKARQNYWNNYYPTVQWTEGVESSVTEYATAPVRGAYRKENASAVFGDGTGTAFLAPRIHDAERFLAVNASNGPVEVSAQMIGQTGFPGVYMRTDGTEGVFGGQFNSGTMPLALEMNTTRYLTLDVIQSVHPNRFVVGETNGYDKLTVYGNGVFGNPAAYAPYTDLDQRVSIVSTNGGQLGFFLFGADGVNNRRAYIKLDLDVPEFVIGATRSTGGEIPTIIRSGTGNDIATFVDSGVTIRTGSALVVNGDSISNFEGDHLIVSAGQLNVWDGIGSGLNSDLLDGQEGAYYLSRSNHVGPVPWALVTNTPTTLAGYGITDAVWTASNDGAGSGLDADLLDGQHGAYYLDRANHTGTQDWSTLTNTPTSLYGYGITDGPFLPLAAGIDEKITGDVQMSNSVSSPRILFRTSATNGMSIRNEGAFMTFHVTAPAYPYTDSKVVLRIETNGIVSFTRPPRAPGSTFGYLTAAMGHASGTNPATASTRNYIPVISFDPTVVQQYRWTWQIPNGFNSGAIAGADGMLFTLHWTTSATAGDARWIVRMQRLTGEDIDSDSFAGGGGVITTASATAGTVVTSSTASVGLDSAVGGDFVEIKVERDVSHATDTIDADAIELIGIEIRHW